MRATSASTSASTPDKTGTSTTTSEWGTGASPSVKLWQFQSLDTDGLHK